MQKGILLLAICMVMSISLRAQDAEQITLQEAIDLALQNNYQLKQASNNLNLAEYQEFSEKADFLPSLSASARGSQTSGSQFIPGTDNFGNFTARGFNGSVNLGLPIFAGFENINSLKSSQFNTESEEESLQRTRENIIFNTASSYLQVVLDKELLEIAEQNLASSEKTLEQVQAQVEVGSRPTVDQYNQESVVASNELEVINRENALKLSKLRLIRQLQVDPLKNYEFSIPEVEQNQINVTDYDLNELVNSALENRSDLRSEQFAIQAIEHQLKATRGSLFPSLNFNASLSSDYSDQRDLSFNDQFFDLNVTRSFGISLNVPIFNNLNRRTNVQSQEINYKNAKLNLENTELQVVQEVNQAFNDYESIVKQLESTQKALRAAEKSYETQQERYQVGAGTLIELSDANARFVQAQSDRARAVFNFIFQQKLLDYYIGKLNESISFE